MNTNKQIQMSESFLNSAVLAVSGGFQDAYTYFARDKVFSNAQTGNVVLMSQEFMMGNFIGGIKYLLPFLAFGFGVFVTTQINARYKMARKLHWRQLVILIEIVILAIVGFIPHSFNMVATVLVSFSCAMQVQAFRKECDRCIVSVFKREKERIAYKSISLLWNNIFLRSWCRSRW